MATDGRAVLLNAAILGAAHGAAATGVGGVTFQTQSRPAPPRPVGTAPTMPPPLLPPVEGEDPAALAVATARLKAAWDAAPPAARVAFLVALADVSLTQ